MNILAAFAGLIAMAATTAVAWAIRPRTAAVVSDTRCPTCSRTFEDCRCVTPTGGAR